MLTTLLVEGEEDSGPSSPRSVPCLKIPDLVLDPPAGTEERDRLLHPGAIRVVAGTRTRSPGGGGDTKGHPPGEGGAWLFF